MNPNTPHIIIYSHGFGVRKESRGFFTDIARAVPVTRNVMFDYDSVHAQSNTLTVMPINQQAQKLRKVINATRAEFPDAIIDLVCHSQGCVVAALVKPRGIRKVIMLAPPDEVSQEAYVERLSARTETEIDVTKTTRLARADGSTTVIHPEYWQSLAGIKAVKLYNLLARVTTLRIINARQDEMLGPVTFEGLDPTVSLVTLDGDHNFKDDEARKRILYILQKELAV